MNLYYGNSIKIYRIINNLSQDELAKEFNISKSMLGMLENNKRKSSIEVEIRIKNILQISLNKVMQNKLIIDFEKYLMNFFKMYEDKNGYDMLKQLFNDVLTFMKNFTHMQHLYFGRLVDNKGFFEIPKMSSFREFRLYLETEEYYYKNTKLKNFYKTYTEFILDNFDNVIETIQNYSSLTEKINSVIIFNNKIPLNIKLDYTKIMKSIDTTTYADYNTYKINPNFIGKTFGFPISDESMNFKYEKGDIVIIDITDKLENNKDYLIRIGKDFLLRRIQMDNDKIIFKALNPSYDSNSYLMQTIENFDIEIIGKVIDIKIN